MRKVVMLNRISLDGFFAGIRENLHEWAVQDPKVDQAAHEMMNPDTLLLGRVTYQLFESHWPKVSKNPDASKGEKVLAKELDEMTKVVFSKTLDKVNWVNTQLVKGDVIKAVKDLKQGKGADITIFGSGTIVQQLANEGLIDEYLLTVTPVVLGEGKPLFKDVHQFSLDLVEERKFKSGNTILHYKLANGK